MAKDTGYFIDKNDARIANNFIYKSSFINLARRTTTNGVTAAVDITVPAITTVIFATLPALTADDDLNDGYLLVKNDNGFAMMFKILTSIFATLTITVDITNSVFNTDETGNFATKDYSVSVIMQKRYMGEIDTAIDVNLGTTYTAIKSRTPKKIWKYYAVDGDGKINFDLLSNEKTLAKDRFKLEQIEDSKFYARNSDATPAEFFMFIEDVALSGDQFRDWFLPKVLFSSGLNHNVSAVGDPPTYPQEGMIQNDGVLDTDVIREEE